MKRKVVYVYRLVLLRTQRGKKASIATINKRVTITSLRLWLIKFSRTATNMEIYEFLRDTIHKVTCRKDFMKHNFGYLSDTLHTQNETMIAQNFFVVNL